jgi:hypothetical protein
MTPPQDKQTGFNATLAGVLPVFQTPFHENGTLDPDTLEPSNSQ